MRKLITIIMVSVLLVGFAGMAEAEFRGYKWGTDRDTIIENEGEPLESSEDMIYYEDELMGIDVFIGYQFIDDQLYKGIYLDFESHTYKVDYLGDLMTWIKGLKDKYGEVDGGGGIVWYDDLYKDGSDAGLAKGISYGDAIIRFYWDEGDTTITAKANGGNGRVNVGIVYRDPTVEEPEPSTEGL